MTVWTVFVRSVGDNEHAYLSHAGCRSGDTSFLVEGSTARSWGTI